MELDVARLRQSKFSATPNAEAFRAGVLLWCASWHQLPAASLPDDDVELADLAGYGKMPFSVRFWRKVRTEALHGWQLCSDRRLYHPIIAEKARAAWAARLEHFYERLKDRARKENKVREKSGQPPLLVPSFEAWISAGRPTELLAENQPPSAGNPAEIDLKGKGRGKREGEGEGEPNSAPDGAGAAAPPPAPPPDPPPPPPAPTPAPPSAPEDSLSAFDRRKRDTWRAAKSLLNAHGMPLAQAGTFLGALHRDYKALGEEIFLAVLESAVKERPGEPEPWLKAAFQRVAGDRKTGNRQEQLEERNRDLVARRAANRQEGPTQ
jgi:hypothetical protein